MAAGVRGSNVQRRGMVNSRTQSKIGPSDKLLTDLAGVIKENFDKE